MKNKFLCSLAILVVLAACGKDEDKVTAQAQLETVQEGTAPGVTSTIHGPGETIPPMTGTNMDTTTAFTLSPNAVPPATQPGGGTIAGTFPDPTGTYPPTTGTYRPPPVTRSTPSRTPVTRRTEPDPQSPPAESSEPTTTTTTMTSSQPPPQSTPTPPAQQQPKKDADDDDEDEDDSEQTDTAPPPPPPPPRGR